MSDKRSDAAFVDALLRQAQESVADPRIRFAHVRHAGPPPAPAEPPASRRSSGARSAWTQTRSLAGLLLDLWQHSWIPDPPVTATVKYIDENGGVGVTVSANTASVDADVVTMAADRLLVRGFIPDDVTAQGFTASRGHQSITFAVTATGVEVALSATLEEERLSLGVLAGLPSTVSTSTDD